MVFYLSKNKNKMSKNPNTNEPNNINLHEELKSKGLNSITELLNIVDPDARLTDSLVSNGKNYEEALIELLQNYH